MNSKVVAIIPARSGSKGLKKKNIRLLGGKPLIAWSIEAASNCGLVDRVLVSTDSQEFADIAIEYGADVPFLRPAQIAGDSAKVEEALVHAVTWLEENEQQYYENVLLLQTTDVFRNRGIVDDVLSTLINNPDLDTVFAAMPDYKNYWEIAGEGIQRMCNHNYIPRQQRNPIYREDTGVALATRVSTIKNGQRVGNKVEIVSHSNKADFIDIHTEFDLWLANVLIDQRGIVPNKL
jgi:CMP-N-acetylneuraminic acid synthetase